jgi:hypothetical protein
MALLLFLTNIDRIVCMSTDLADLWISPSSKMFLNLYMVIRPAAICSSSLKFEKEKEKR